jgi:hypothetical protein
MRTPCLLGGLLFALAFASNARAGTDEEWDDLVREALRTRHQYSVKCRQSQTAGKKLCIHSVEIRAEGRRYVLQRTLGPGVDFRMMCLDGKCVKAN